MKGKMKKLVAFALAAIMVLAMGITVSAAGGTITVADTIKDAEYTLYKVFDVTTDGDSAYNYMIPESSPYLNWAEDSNEMMEFNKVFSASSNGGRIYVKKAEGVNDADVVTYLNGYIDRIGILKGTEKSGENGEDVVFQVTDDGYYYVQSTVSQGAAAMVDTVTGNVTIHEKNDVPGWGEEGKVADDGNTYFVGDTIHYTLTYRALNYANGNKITQYVVKDTPDTGIVIDTKTVLVTIGGKAPVEGMVSGTLTDETGMVIKWVNDDGEFLYTAPAEIVITYDATVTEAATVGQNGISNEATIAYNDEEPTEVEETVYMGSITINKYDGENTDIKLEATFVISDKNLGGDGAKFLKYDPDADGSKYEWVDSIEEATKYVTAENGKVEISGLKAGTYYLIETEAPDGYNLLSGGVEVKLEVPGANTNVDQDPLLYTADVPNNKGVQLPSTGGIGTTIFYVVGGLLVAGAGILLITKKRMKKEQ